MWMHQNVQKSSTQNYDRSIIPLRGVLHRREPATIVKKLVTRTIKLQRTMLLIMSLYDFAFCEIIEIARYNIAFIFISINVLY